MISDTISFRPTCAAAIGAMSQIAAQLAPYDPTTAADLIRLSRKLFDECVVAGLERQIEKTYKERP